MSNFNIAEAKTRFSELVQKAMLGEEVMVAPFSDIVTEMVLLSMVPEAEPEAALPRAGVWRPAPPPRAGRR